MKPVNLFAVGMSFAVFGGLLSMPLAPSHAEGDWPYGGNTTQDFENDYRTYKSNDGYATNFVNELLPLGNFGDDGRLKFESRDVQQRGADSTRLDHSNTGLQLDFKF